MKQEDKRSYFSVALTILSYSGAASAVLVFSYLVPIKWLRVRLREIAKEIMEKIHPV